MPPDEITNSPKPIHGRGASLNPINRFEKIELEKDPEYDTSEDPLPKTQFFKDTSKSPGSPRVKDSPKLKIPI